MGSSYLPFLCKGRVTHAKRFHSLGFEPLIGSGAFKTFLFLLKPCHPLFVEVPHPLLSLCPLQVQAELPSLFLLKNVLLANLFKNASFLFPFEPLFLSFLFSRFDGGLSFLLCLQNLTHLLVNELHLECFLPVSRCFQSGDVLLSTSHVLLQLLLSMFSVFFFSPNVLFSPSLQPIESLLLLSRYLCPLFSLLHKQHDVDFSLFLESGQEELSPRPLFFLFLHFRISACLECVHHLPLMNGILLCFHLLLFLFLLTLSKLICSPPLNDFFVRLLLIQFRLALANVLFPLSFELSLTQLSDFFCRFLLFPSDLNLPNVLFSLFLHPPPLLLLIKKVLLFLQLFAFAKNFQLFSSLLENSLLLRPFLL
mmetsp:Transcript_4369/g.8811  ORF Transcript_4369/g.8811 Transcript_4369/m.8811 type:complete len:366 (-) Transcript_4369:1116-2213(-)